MTERIYHGDISPSVIANALIAKFSNRNLRVQQYSSGDSYIIQIATTPLAVSGGSTALSILLQKVVDGISVELSKQSWLGIAASIGVTTLSALQNPLNLLGRLDDIAQDIEYMQLVENVWEVVDNTARSIGSGYELSNRLNRYICLFCSTPNPIGESRCLACGAPLGESLPITCKSCGYIVLKSEKHCPNCKNVL